MADQAIPDRYSAAWTQIVDQANRRKIAVEVRIRKGATVVDDGTILRGPFDLYIKSRSGEIRKVGAAETFDQAIVMLAPAIEAEPLLGPDALRDELRAFARSLAILTPRDVAKKSGADVPIYRAFRDRVLPLAWDNLVDSIRLEALEDFVRRVGASAPASADGTTTAEVITLVELAAEARGLVAPKETGKKETGGEVAATDRNSRRRAYVPRQHEVGERSRRGADVTETLRDELERDAARADHDSIEDGPAFARADVMLREAALALAESRSKNKHGQLCPVWTQRLKKVRHAATIADCDCWILSDATADAAVVLAALGRSESPSPEGLRHRLLWPPHPGDAYSSSALCACGDFQWDADSQGALFNATGDVLSDWTVHAVESPAPEGLTEAILAWFDEKPTGYQWSTGERLLAEIAYRLSHERAARLRSSADSGTEGT